MRLRDKVETPEFQVEFSRFKKPQLVGILPFKKAFIVFYLKSLVPPEDGTAIDNVKSKPSAAGSKL